MEAARKDISTLTDDQIAALNAVADWFVDPDSMEARIDGYAGTGKTTLAGVLISYLGLKRSEIVCVTTAGRAAKVARSKMRCPAMTISRAFFRPVHLPTEASLRLKKKLDDDVKNGLVVEDSDEYEERMIVVRLHEEPAWEEHLSQEVEDAELIMVDEHSMVSLRHRDVIRKAGTKVLAIGDPFQLPSPDHSAGERQHPEFQEGRPAYHRTERLWELTEIVRTESNIAGFNICATAATLRRGEMPDLGAKDGIEIRAGDLNRIIHDRALLKTMFEADVSIVGMHRNRHLLTRAIRREALDTDVPSIAPGDKLLVTHNHQMVGLYNGDLLTVGTDIHLEKVHEVPGGCDFLQFWTNRLDLRRHLQHYYQATLARAGDDSSKVRLPDRIDIVCPATAFRWPYEPLVDYSKVLSKQIDGDVMRVSNYIDSRKLPFFQVRMEYGHTITAHKAQGSEFDRVVVVDDGFSSDPETTFRWRYTALTRAKKHCLYIMTGRFGSLAEIVDAMNYTRSTRTDSHG